MVNNGKRKETKKISKKELLLLWCIFLSLVMMLGMWLNFKTVTENGFMPVLTHDERLVNYETDYYKSVQSCEGIEYCLFVDRFGGIIEMFNIFIFFSIGDMIVLFAVISEITSLYLWARCYR